MGFLSSIFDTPTAFSPASSTVTSFSLFTQASSGLDTNALMHRSTPEAHGNHPPLLNLLWLVSQAVLEVVCVSLPGYIIARQGMFNKEQQKFLANLNVSLFTPCLIFTKLASQLSLEKIVDLAIIPVIFVFMTLCSYACAALVCRVFKFGKRARNFVMAMGMFGNSNSLPISMVVSLSMTISGLHWDKVPNDNDSNVAARGILYLLIFQQLGQFLRWTWGLHLLNPRMPNEEHDDGTPPTPAVERPYRDFPDQDNSDSDTDIEAVLIGEDPFETPRFENSFVGLQLPVDSKQLSNGHSVSIGNGHDFLKPGALAGHSRHHSRSATITGYSETGSDIQSAAATPLLDGPDAGSRATSRSNSPKPQSEQQLPMALPSGHPPLATPTNGNITSFPPILPQSPPHIPASAKSKLPASFLKVWNPVASVMSRGYKTFMSIMNPPLWAMLIALFVASIPKLQALFFTPGTFVQNSVTRAVAQSGNVAVPLILVVLGANLAGSTADPRPAGVELPTKSKRHQRHDNKLLAASLLSRMVLPYIVMAPVLALVAKYVPVSILDDPIFVIVCFLLVGAPSALQLAQICQINGVYEEVMARILFWSYVVVVLPSTLILVVTAIEVVEWSM